MVRHNLITKIQYVPHAESKTKNPLITQISNVLSQDEVSLFQTSFSCDSDFVAVSVRDTSWDNVFASKKNISQLQEP